MEREMEFSPEQRVKLSYLLRTKNFAVTEVISNDKIIKTKPHTLVLRDFFDYEYSDKDIYKLLFRMRRLRGSKICNFLLNRMGLEELGKDI